MGSHPLLQLIDVDRGFPFGVRALVGVSLTIERGEAVAIMGPSGSGKSTLLHVLGLLDRPTYGRYLLDGVDTGSMSSSERARLRATRIGFVFQSYHLIPHLTVAENVALAVRYSDPGAPDVEPRVEAVLDSVGMLDRRDAFPSTLSGGEQQRTAIARALVRRPQLVLCDEPTGNLDSVNARRVLDLLVRLHDMSRTLIIVTHDAGVAHHADRVIQIVDGRVIGP